MTIFLLVFAAVLAAYVGTADVVMKTAKDGASQCAVPDGALTSQSGELTSPNYPYDYPNNQLCVWHLHAPELDSWIYMKFTSFNLEKHDYDYVAVYDGLDTRAPRLGKLSGQADVNRMPPFISSGPSLTVVFVSDDKTTHPGFQAKYRAISVASFEDSNGAPRLLRGHNGTVFHQSDDLQHTTCYGSPVYRQIFPPCADVEPDLFPECPDSGKKKDQYLYAVKSEQINGWMVGPEPCVAEGWLAVHDTAAHPQHISGMWQKRTPRGFYEDCPECFVRVYDNWPGKRPTGDEYNADTRCIEPSSPIMDSIAALRRLVITTEVFTILSTVVLGVIMALLVVFAMRYGGKIRDWLHSSSDSSSESQSLQYANTSDEEEKGPSSDLVNTSTDAMAMIRGLGVTYR